MNEQRIIIVANRLPVQLKEKNGAMSLIQSSGGLVSSMLSYLTHSGAGRYSGKALWVGASDISEKKFNSLEKEMPEEHSSFDLHPVFLPEAVKGKFYHGFCNDCIWPLFHYFPSYAKFNADFYAAYKSANACFMEKVLEVYRPGDLVWIHDYHLMNLPGLLRKKLPEASIGFFLHIPFPSFEVFRIVPNDWKREILSGLLGADLIGFHTSDYMQYFLKSVQHTLGYDVSGRKVHMPDRVVAADAMPVSIDFNKFYTAANTEAVFEEKNKIRRSMSGRKVIVSVDRLDYSKALINRLESFGLFLEQQKYYRGKVTYILLVVPSREIITKYKENKMEIERLISSINGKYGTIDWTPVFYQYRSVDFSKLTALYFSADVALITPLRDGMNLVAKEFVSTRVDKRGVLILSETAGAAAELKEAVIVNPTDRQEIAAALLKALTMPVEEQVARNESMQARIRNYDVVKWAEDFVTQVAVQKSLQEFLKIKEVTPQIGKSMLRSFQEADQKLILLDYDGTLAPFARTPQQAAPSEKLLELLGRLSADSSSTIALVSGRKRDSLEAWFGHLDLTLVAEHGGFFKVAGRPWSQPVQVNTEWKEKILPLFHFYQDKCPGSFIEEKTLSLAWHYRNTDKEYGVIRARELEHELNALAAELGFQVMEGNMVIEARSGGIDKGAAASSLIGQKNYDFILAIGDDKTDEDMFKAIPEQGFSIKVGLTQSHARFNVRQQSDVIRFLAGFCTELAEA